jgi:predicted hotdog family 3-hydroxylacyl-ACP dehydratase
MSGATLPTPPALRLGRAQIDDYLPHRGAMRLLAGVRAYDRDTIECLVDGHRDPAHPLRARGRLGAACAIEYAAQAMAVHGALCGDSKAPPAGSLLAARDVRFWVARLDDIEEDLLIHCHCLARDARAANYRFLVATASSPLVSGRATVQFIALQGHAL